MNEDDQRSASSADETPPTETPAAAKAEKPDRTRAAFFYDFRSNWRKALVELLQVIGVFGAVALAIALMAAIGQIAALGIATAAALYGKWWILSPVIGGGGFLVMVVLESIFSVIGSLN